MKKFLFFLIASSIAWTQESDEMPLIQAIIIASKQENRAPPLEKVSVFGLDLPGPLADLQKRLEPLVGKEMATENLLDIKKEILSFFAEHNHPLIAVEIPEQSVTNGTVQLIVIEPILDQVQVTGNRWFSSKSIENAVGLKLGCKVPEKMIMNRLAWLNMNPFLHGDAFYSPGSDNGTTSLNIATRDRFPLRTYAGADNTGSESTGNERWFAGFNASLGLNTLLSYQFTSSFIFPAFESHLAHFTFFLPWRHELVLYGTYATIHPDIQDFKSHGKDVQGSFRYLAPIGDLFRPFLHEISFGFDYKLYNNALFFLSDVKEVFPITSKNAAISQFYLGYKLDDIFSSHHTSFRIEILFSPAYWLPNQSNDDYNQLRRGAKNRYLYGRLAAGDIIELPRKFEFAALVRLQGTTDPLLPSEQFGLGGSDTVRGYLERVFLADAAVCANGEFRSPPLSLFSKAKNELRFIAFADFARGWNLQNSSDEGKNATLLGVGPGLRYNIIPYFTARLDYGFNLHSVEFDPNRFGRLHFSAILSY